MRNLRPRTPLLLSLLLLLGSSPSPGDSLWVESTSMEGFPEVGFTAVPLNRATWRALKEKRIRARIDDRPALLLSVDRVTTPPHVHLLIDRSEPAREHSPALHKLWGSLLGALPRGSRVTTQLMTDHCETLLPATAQRDKLLAALRSHPHEGEYPTLHKALDRTAEAIREAPGERHVVILLALGADPTLAPSERLRRSLLEEYAALGAPVLALSLGSEGDRSLLRALADASGGESLHSWSLRNLRTGLGRYAVGLRLAHRVVVESPWAKADGSLRSLELKRTGKGRKLGKTTLRFPGVAPALTPPTPGPPAPGPQVSPPGSAPPPVAAPTPVDSPRRPRRAPLETPALELPAWPVEGQTEAERELTALASSHLLVLRSDADAGLAPALRGMEKAARARDYALARHLHRHARISLSFLGSHYGRVARALDDLIEGHAADRASRAAFLSTQRARLTDLRARWSSFKDALLRWPERLPESSR